MAAHKEIWVMNFEHDLALAANDPYYIAPKVARAMNCDLRMLAFWLGETGKTWVMEEGNKRPHLNEHTQEAMQELGIDYTDKFISVSKKGKRMELEVSDELRPWGWDPSVAFKPISYGVKHPVIPDLEHIRTWSHRNKTISLLKTLAESGLFDSKQTPIETNDQQLIKTLCENGQYLLKSPLSGSGRGLWWALNGYDFNVERWSKSIIERVGSVMIEPIWRKKSDYAMEFECRNGQVEYVGLSHFEADSAGVYRCNRLEDDEQIEQQIASEIGDDKTVGQLKEAIGLWIIQNIAPNYNGVVGIDMLTGEIGGETRLNPCVEINLRMTMGMAAHEFYRKWVKKGAHGEFATIHCKGEKELQERAATRSQAHPIKISEGKIEEGYLLLTEDNGHYGIEIEIWKE
ncbi:MAG: hypothetical protein KBT32_00960 [Bacteroidales bacterium]|nr:hypothetical protein [Candidatus Physcocola equi]